MLGSWDKRGSYRRKYSSRFGWVCIALLAWTMAETPHAISQDVKTPASSLDQPLAFMYEARKAYSGVRDYTCTLVKQESLAANPEVNIIHLKFRDQPFSVYMRWLSPAKFKNQEVAYFHGKNRNQLRVHAKGFFKGIAGFVSVDVNDPRVRECSRHNIYEAGIGYVIEKTIQHWEAEKKTGKIQAKVEEYEYNNRRCYRVETVETERRTDAYCYRSVLYIDQESKLPIRNENYGWPRWAAPPTAISWRCSATSTYA